MDKTSFTPDLYALVLGDSELLESIGGGAASGTTTDWQQYRVSVTEAAPRLLSAGTESQSAETGSQPLGGLLDGVPADVLEVFMRDPLLHELRSEQPEASGEAAAGAATENPRPAILEHLLMSPLAVSSAQTQCADSTAQDSAGAASVTLRGLLTAPVPGGVPPIFDSESASEPESDRESSSAGQVSSKSLSRQRKRAQNRLAAVKLRAKRREQEIALQKRVAELEQQNQRLKTELAQLEHGVSLLRSLLAGAREKP